MPSICVPLKIRSVERPMGGQPKSDACGEMSRAERRSAQESHNQRDAARILFTLGRGRERDWYFLHRESDRTMSVPTGGKTSSQRLWFWCALKKSRSR